jgi:hypothetical protein
MIQNGIQNQVKNMMCPDLPIFQEIKLRKGAKYRSLLHHQFSKAELDWLCEVICSNAGPLSRKQMIDHICKRYNLLVMDVESWLVSYENGAAYFPPNYPLDIHSTCEILKASNNGGVSDTEMQTIIRSEVNNTLSRRYIRKQLLMAAKKHPDGVSRDNSFA